MDATVVNLTNFETTILFILGVFAVLVAIDKGIEAFNHLFLKKKSRQEADQNARLRKMEETLVTHESRLNRGDSHFDAISRDTAQILNVQNAILMHEITGNGIDKLKTVKSELDTYMANRT